MQPVEVIEERSSDQVGHLSGSPVILSERPAEHTASITIKIITELHTRRLSTSEVTKIEKFKIQSDFKKILFWLLLASDA